MCGKFTQMYAWQHAHAFSPPLVATDGGELVTATPMCFAKVMRLDCAGARELIPMRWGFAGKDDAAPMRPKHMHARCETIDGKPTFAQAFAHARGILMVHTFNEGEELPSGKTKQWVIAPRDGQPIAIAVICEQWNNGTETLQTFVQVTTPANALVSRITDRMPAILPRDTWAAWLGETAVPLTEVKALLRTFEDGGNWTLTEQEPKSPVKISKPPKTDTQQSLF
jgi:putative SOS response-associated peptidase YedK